VIDDVYHGTTPKNWREAVRSDQWKESMYTELRALQEQGTWTIVPRSSVDRDLILPSKWVFKTKVDSSGHVIKLKSRIVVCGNFQSSSTGLYAPVLQISSLRLLLVMAVRSNLKLRKLDVSNAFVQSSLPEEERTYMNPPPGVGFGPGEVLELRKSLYGLRQAPFLWNQTLDKTLRELGFRKLLYDSCIYVHASSGTILGIYVDDLLLLSRKEETLDYFSTELSKKFKLTDHGVPSEILGIGIERSEEAIKMHCRGKLALLAEILQKHKYLTRSRKIRSPMCAGYLVSDVKSRLLSSAEHGLYRKLVGLCMYIAGTIRPDVLHATTVLGSALAAPRLSNLNAIVRVAQYLISQDLELELKVEDHDELEVYTDSNWTKRSYTGIHVRIC
jgi:hypothetical protein